MRHVKGSWRTVISTEDALNLEAQIKLIKTYTLDDKNPSMDMDKLRRFDRTYRIYLNPATIDIINGDDNWKYIMMPVDYYNAMLRLSYDFRNPIPFCEINIKEAALQLLESYLWHCNHSDHSNKIETKILPALAYQKVRCPKCGRDMRKDRDPILPQLREDLIKYGALYARAINIKPANEFAR